MQHQADRYRFTLSQPIAAEPGTVFNYNGGGTTCASAPSAGESGMSSGDDEKTGVARPPEHRYNRLRSFAVIRRSPLRARGGAGLDRLHWVSWSP